MNLDKLKESRRVAWVEFQRVANVYHGLEGLFKEIEAQWKAALKAYHDADMELALVDGRRKIIEPSTKRRSAPEPELTEDQIDRLAKRFGITLPEVPEDLGTPGEEVKTDMSDNPLDQ